jgi:hypothetical protein
MASMRCFLVALLLSVVGATDAPAVEKQELNFRLVK